jgi:hypothetical protein
VGIGINSPIAKLDVRGSAGVTSFTGTTRLGITVGGSTSTNDYSGIDFIGANSNGPTARIGVLSTGGGSTLSFGTSNSYASGITNTAVSIDPSGNLSVTGNVSIGANWSVSQSGTALYFLYNGSRRAVIDSSGNFTVIGSVTAYGSI